MRYLSLLRNSLALASLAMPAVLFGQFQQPSSDELKMTADPKYPDAAAVILNREEKFDDLLHYESEYVRVKILKESAKGMATVPLGYTYKGFDSVEAVSGRTIHADGTIVPLNVKPADLMHEKQGQIELHEVVFNLPSVEVGSILEYYYQLRFNEHSCPQPYWEIQGNYPVRKAKYSFTPCAGVLDNTPGLGGMGVIDRHGNPLSDLLWYVNLPPGKTFGPNASHRFAIDFDDIPPLPNEQFMPPIESQRYQIRFYWAPGTSGGAYWNTEAKYWLSEVDGFAKTTTTIKDAAAGIVAAGDSEMDKAKKLYMAVEALDNTDFTRKKSDVELHREGLKAAKRAEDTWNQKSGSGEDLALLYLALLRASGLTAYPMKVVDREQGLFNPSYLNAYQLSDTVVILSTGGQEIVLDPAEKMCPFQMVSWRHSGAGGIRQIEKGTESWLTPLLPYNVNTLVRRGDLTVGTDGSVTGKLQFGMVGQDALRWRQLALRVDEDTLKHRFDEWLKTQVPAGVEAHLVRFSKLDDPTGDLNAYASVSGTPGAATAKRLLLPGSFFVNTEDRAFIEQPNRQLPVDMHYAGQVKDGVLYHLPAGFSLETTAPTASVPWPGHAVFSIKSTTAGNDVTVMTTLARNFTFLQPDEYGQLRDFYQKVAAADQQQLVLHAAAGDKGN